MDLDYLLRGSINHFHLKVLLSWIFLRDPFQLLLIFLQMLHRFIRINIAEIRYFTDPETIFVIKMAARPVLTEFIITYSPPCFA